MSETSVRAAAGWSSGAMVARYTNALSGELAVDEFQHAWINQMSANKDTNRPLGQGETR